MTVLITGAGGFAGGHLVERLAQTSADVVGWHRPGHPPAGARPPIRWMAVDLLDQQSVTRSLALAAPAVIYHCAGAAHAGESWQRAASTLETNVLATHRLFEAIRATRSAAAVLVPGSALVYRASDGPLHEDSPLRPATPYATSKLAQELLGRSVFDNDGIPVFLTRSFNHAGPRQAPTFSTSSFARQLARIEAGLQAPVIKVGNLDARRDLTDVRDVVRAYTLITAEGTPGRIYNVCSGTALRIGDVLDRLLARARVPVEIQPDPDRLRPSDTPLLLGDPSRLEKETTWTPDISLDQMLDDLLDHWRTAEIGG